MSPLSLLQGTSMHTKVTLTKYDIYDPILKQALDNGSPIEIKFSFISVFMTLISVFYKVMINDS